MILTLALMRRLGLLSLLLGILVWDCSDEAVTPTVLVDLARMPLIALIN
jgi:hypothetical protein